MPEIVLGEERKEDMRQKEELEKELNEILERLANLFSECYGREICDHKWIYSDFIYTSIGQLRYKICEICGKEEEERILWDYTGTTTWDAHIFEPHGEFNRTRKKFGKTPLTQTCSYMFW